MEREFVTVINIEKGIIMLVESNGSLSSYRQRGINNLNINEINQEINSGRLAKDWNNYNELPINYSISFEDPEVCGRAVATYGRVLYNKRETRKVVKH